MKIEKTANKIIITNPQDLNIIQTLNCFEDYDILKKEYLKSLFFKTMLLLIVI